LSQSGILPHLQKVMGLGVVTTLIELPDAFDNLTRANLFYTTQVQRWTVPCDKAVVPFKVFFIVDLNHTLQGERKERG